MSIDFDMEEGSEGSEIVGIVQTYILNFKNLDN